MIRKIVPYGLRNIGPVSLGWLREAGINSRADLIRMGAVEAYLKIKATQSRASLNLLWSLAGAERGLAWNRLTEDTRERLLRELDAAQDVPGSKPKSTPKSKTVAKTVAKTAPKTAVKTAVKTVAKAKPKKQK